MDFFVVAIQHIWIIITTHAGEVLGLYGVEDMSTDHDTIIVFVTAAHKEEAEGIARVLLQERLVACVNILSGVRSLFWWEGKIDEAQETLMLMKTTRDKFSGLSERVQSLHSYEVPEIIAVPIQTGEETYLKWVEESVKERICE